MEHQISVKFDDDVNELLDQLTTRNNCSRAEAVRRSIVIAAKGTEQGAEIGPKIDNLASTLADILRVTVRHADSSTNTQKQMLRYVAQGAIFGSNIAANLGVRDTALEAYEAWKKQNQERI